MSLEDPPSSKQQAPEPDPAQRQQPRRIGVFGGTFDPPHIGHLIVAETVRDALDLDEVRCVVANRPWQKTSERVISDPEIRLEMVRAALAGADALSASRVEIDLGGPSYSMVTLEHMRELEPDVQWLLVVGADAAAGLDSWHRSEELAQTVEVIVVNRPGDVCESPNAGTPPPGWRWQAVEVPSIGVSSTDLRKRVADGRSIHFLTPNSVVDIIDHELLYRHRR